MRKYNNIYIIRCVVTLLIILFAIPSAEAQKKNTKKKKNEEVELAEPMPDKPSNEYKAVPDAFLKPKVKPEFKVVSHFGTGIGGIDVSHYQGTIDWKSVSQDKGAGFVYIKASEANTLIDDTYSYNVSEAKRYGLKVGSYHFFRANVSAQSQCDNFMKVVDLKKQDLIPIIDVEALNGATIAQMQSRLLELLNLVTKEFGRKPMIYTGKNFYDRNFAGYPQFKQYKFMIAQYTAPEPALLDGADYLIWQYTAKGHVNGVRGNVDQSKFVGGHSLSEIML